MPDFSYIARDLSGSKITGTMTAASEAEVVSALSGQSLFPISVHLEKSRQGLSEMLGGRVKGQVMATTYSQLASLLRSGVPLLRAIRVIRDQTSNSRLKEVLGEVHDRVEDGATLADAINRYPRVFNEMAVNMIRAGGEGGFLEDALERVAKFTEDSEDLKGRITGALAYPVFLLAVGTLVVGALIVFCIPMVAPMFDTLEQQGELPWVTSWLLGLSDAVGSIYSLFVFGLLLIGAIGVRSWFNTEEGRLTADRLKLRLPIAGDIFMSLAVARFCRVLGTLLKNGVPILKSLEISRGAASNRVLSQAIAEASENITAGQSLAKPLAASGHFPSTVIEMITVAEESNTLDSVLTEIADGLERRTERRLELMIRLLEPIMLLLLAGIVLVVVIALLMPLIKMSSTI